MIEVKKDQEYLYVRPLNNSSDDYKLIRVWLLCDAGYHDGPNCKYLFSPNLKISQRINSYDDFRQLFANGELNNIDYYYLSDNPEVKYPDEQYEKSYNKLLLMLNQNREAIKKYRPKKWREDLDCKARNFTLTRQDIAVNFFHVLAYGCNELRLAIIALFHTLAFDLIQIKKRHRQYSAVNKKLDDIPHMLLSDKDRVQLRENAILEKERIEGKIKDTSRLIFSIIIPIIAVVVTYNLSKCGESKIEQRIGEVERFINVYTNQLPLHDTVLLMSNEMEGLKISNRYLKTEIEKKSGVKH